MTHQYQHADAAIEYRNEHGEITTDEEVADVWSESALEVDYRDGPDAPWAPWNYEAGFDYEANRYLDPERDREFQAAVAKARKEAGR